MRLEQGKEKFLIDHVHHGVALNAGAEPFLELSPDLLPVILKRFRSSGKEDLVCLQTIDALLITVMITTFRDQDAVVDTADLKGSLSDHLEVMEQQDRGMAPLSASALA